MIDLVTAILWLFGAVFALLAALGLLRMPDVFTRMQASTKASTLGLGCLLIGAALQLGDLASLIRAASIGAFIFLTNSVSAHVIARASYLADVPLWTGTVLDERRGADQAKPGEAASHGPVTDADQSPASPANRPPASHRRPPPD